MSDLENRLNYIEETKDLIRISINNIGGTLQENSPFKDYPIQLSNIIGENPASQSTLNNIMNNVININGQEV